MLLVMLVIVLFFFFFSSRRRHTRWPRDWSSDVCSSDLLLFGSAHRVVIGGDDTRSYEHLVLDQTARGQVAVGHDPHPLADRDVEIGRASCRERVWIAVVVGEV